MRHITDEDMGMDALESRQYILQPGPIGCCREQALQVILTDPHGDQSRTSGERLGEFTLADTGDRRAISTEVEDNGVAGQATCQHGGVTICRRIVSASAAGGRVAQGYKDDVARGGTMVHNRLRCLRTTKTTGAD